VAKILWWQQRHLMKYGEISNRRKFFLNESAIFMTAEYATLVSSSIFITKLFDADYSLMGFDSLVWGCENDLRLWHRVIAR